LWNAPSGQKSPSHPTVPLWRVTEPVKVGPETSRASWTRIFSSASPVVIILGPRWSLLNCRNPSHRRSWDGGKGAPSGVRLAGLTLRPAPAARIPSPPPQPAPQPAPRSLLLPPLSPPLPPPPPLPPTPHPDRRLIRRLRRFLCSLLHRSQPQPPPPRAPAPPVLTLCSGDGVSTGKPAH
jgi:hypothetical protein